MQLVPSIWMPPCLPSAPTTYSPTYAVSSCSSSSASWHAWGCALLEDRKLCAERLTIPAFPWENLSPLPAVTPWQQAKGLTEVLGGWPNIGGNGAMQTLPIRVFFLIKLRMTNMLGELPHFYSLKRATEEHVLKLVFQPIIFCEFLNKLK